MRAALSALRVQRNWVLFLFAGIATEAIYLLAFARTFPLTELYLTRHADLAKLTRRGQVEALVILVCLALLFAAYLLAIRAVGRLRNRRRAALAVFGFGLLFGLTLLATYPVGALDVFNYIFHGRLIVYYHVNPYVVSPIAYQQDPMLPYLLWTDWPSTYGPLWTAISGAVANTYGGNLLWGLIAFKAVALVFYLATATTVYLLLLRLGRANAAAATLMFAWNPLILFEALVNAHNDIAMACFAALALYALAARRLSLALPLLMASVLIKFLTALFLPVFILGWLRLPGRRRARLLPLLGGICLAAGLAVLLYSLYWGDMQAVQAVLKRRELFTSSLGALAVAWLKENGFPQPYQTASLLSWSLFVPFVLMRLAWLRPGTEAVQEACFDLLFGALVLGTLWFQAWYLICLLTAAVVLADPVRRRLAITFTASAMLVYFVFGYIWFWFPRQLGQVQLQALAVAVVFGPPFLYLVATRLSGLVARHSNVFAQELATADHAPQR
ncbi:MAG: hypothetical protein ACYC4L_01670 [Chloroflexota bacterium]